MVILASNILGTPRATKSAANSTTHRNESTKNQPTCKDIFSNINLITIEQITIASLFNSINAESLTGQHLCDGIHKAIAPDLFISQSLQAQCQIFKRVCNYLEQSRILCRKTQQSGRLVARKVICALWQDTERKKLLKIFERNKRTTAPATLVLDDVMERANALNFKNLTIKQQRPITSDHQVQLNSMPPNIQPPYTTQLISPLLNTVHQAQIQPNLIYGHIHLPYR